MRVCIIFIQQIHLSFSSLSPSLSSLFSANGAIKNDAFATRHPLTRLGRAVMWLRRIKKWIRNVYRNAYSSNLCVTVIITQPPFLSSVSWVTPPKCRRHLSIAPFSNDGLRQELRYCRFNRQTSNSHQEAANLSCIPIHISVGDAYYALH